MLSDNDKFQLQQMIDKNNVEDQTTKIRELKHSGQLRESITELLQFKKDYASLLQTNKLQFENMVLQKNRFLFQHYFQLYNTILKDTINTSILFKLVDVLSDIESGKYDQHEGSYVIGKLLKEIYIDTVLKETTRLDSLSEKIPFVEPKKIRWSEYRNNI